MEIDKFIAKPQVKKLAGGVWNIDDKLQLHVFGDVSGEVVAGGINGAVRRNFSAKAGEKLLDSVCVYQPIVEGRTPAEVKRDGDLLQIGDWQIRRNADGTLSVKDAALRQVTTRIGGSTRRFTLPRLALMAAGEKESDQTKLPNTNIWRRFLIKGFPSGPSSKTSDIYLSHRGVTGLRLKLVPGLLVRGSSVQKELVLMDVDHHAYAGLPQRLRHFRPQLVVPFLVFLLATGF